jgi:hypothetical protein
LKCFELLLIPSIKSTGKNQIKVSIYDKGAGGSSNKKYLDISAYK